MIGMTNGILSFHDSQTLSFRNGPRGMKYGEHSPLTKTICIGTCGVNFRNPCLANRRVSSFVSVSTISGTPPGTTTRECPSFSACCMSSLLAGIHEMTLRSHPIMGTKNNIGATHSTVFDLGTRCIPATAPQHKTPCGCTAMMH